MLSVEIASSNDVVSTSSVSFRVGFGPSPSLGSGGSASLGGSTMAARPAGIADGEGGRGDGALAVLPPFPKVRYPGQPHLTFFMSRLKFMVGMTGIVGIESGMVKPASGWGGLPSPEGLIFPGCPGGVTPGGDAAGVGGLFRGTGVAGGGIRARIYRTRACGYLGIRGGMT